VGEGQNHSSAVNIMNIRGKWEGMCLIARFNWPLYALALTLFIAGMCGLLMVAGAWWRALFLLGCGGAAYFILVSLGVSHLIYDRSDLYRWEWLQRALLGMELKSAIFCHSGFDECSISLRSISYKTDWRILDHFDPNTMTEASILRARNIVPPSLDAIPCSFDDWPLDDECADLVFGILAIHEFRTHAERVKWFIEAKRCLETKGRVILVEHLRDVANFLAFGPGFLHFHSAESWRKSWEMAGMQLRDQFSITPFVRVFVLVKL
jgi:hypothetical protein